MPQRPQIAEEVFTLFNHSISCRFCRRCYLSRPATLPCLVIIPVQIEKPAPYRFFFKETLLDPAEGVPEPFVGPVDPVLGKPRHVLRSLGLRSQTIGQEHADAELVRSRIVIGQGLAVARICLSGRKKKLHRFCTHARAQRNDFTFISSGCFFGPVPAFDGCPTGTTAMNSPSGSPRNRSTSSLMR